MFFPDANHSFLSLSAGVIWREPIPVLHSNQLVSICMQLVPWWHDLGSFRVPTTLLPNFGVNTVLFWSLRCFSSRRMFFSADDDLDGALTAGDGTLIYMSALPWEEGLLVEWNDAARLSLLTNVLIFLQNKQTTQLVERIRKIKSQRLAIQESVVQELIVRGLVVQGCLMNIFLIKILAKLSPLILLIFPLNSTSSLQPSHFHS